MYLADASNVGPSWVFSILIPENSVDVNGKIEVSATNGSKVNKTSSKTTSKAKGKVGFNLAKAGA